MESPGGISDGGVGIEPWQIPKFGGGTTVGGKDWGTSPTGVPAQGLASTGAGGTFAQGEWPGTMAPAWHRGFFGGVGTRTGGGS